MSNSIKDQIKVIGKNKDYKALVSNFSYLTLLQVAGYVFPLITIPYLSRVIGAAGLGRIAFGAAVVTWFMSVSTWGFNFTATRDAARNRNDQKELSRIFSNVIWARSFLSLLCFVVILILIAIIPSFRENWLVILITYLTIPVSIIFPEWLFQALERMKYITILSLCSKLIFTLAIFVFVKKPDDYYLEPLFGVIGGTVAGAISLYLIIKKWKIKVMKPDFQTIFMTINNGKDVFINNFMPNLYNSMSVVLLGSFWGNAATGILSAGSKCLDICYQFMNILARTFFPFLSRHGEKHHVYVKISTILSLCLSIFLFVAAPLLIHIFYTEEFNDAILLARILSISLFFMTISNAYGTNYLILKGKEKPLRNITMICSVIGFCLAVPLIHQWGYLGAAITITAVRGATALAIWTYSQRVRIAEINK